MVTVTFADGETHTMRIPEEFRHANFDRVIEAMKTQTRESLRAMVDPQRMAAYDQEYARLTAKEP